MVPEHFREPINYSKLLPYYCGTFIEVDRETRNNQALDCRSVQPFRCRDIDTIYAHASGGLVDAKDGEDV